MKNMNFRTLEELKAPAELKEKLYAIPDSDGRKPVGFRLNSRIIAAAASIVVITAVSVALFLRMGDNSNLEIKPSQPPQPTVPYTEYVGDTQGTDAADTPSQKPSEGSTTAPTENKQEAVRQMIDSVIDQATQSGTTAPTNPSATTNTSPTQSATQKSTQSAISPTQQSTTKPTHSPTSSPTQPATSKPTQAPTYVPTQAPTTKPYYPTENPTNPPSIDEPPEPLLDPTEAPTQPSINSPEERRQANLTTVEIKRRINKPVSDDVYCVIVDKDGNIMGDPDLFSAQHSADVVKVLDTTYYSYYILTYSPDDHGIDLTPGTYWFHFYSEDYSETEEWITSGVREYY